jgi:hypothetical protein
MTCVMHNLWIRSIGSSPGTNYTLFQLLDRNVLLMQTCGLIYVHSPPPPVLGWSSQVTMISGGWLVVCWVVLFLSKNRMNYDYSIFSLPCESLSGRLCIVSRVVPFLYHLYFCSCTATQAWLAMVTKPVHALLWLAQHTWAVCSHMLKLEPLVVLRFGLLLPLSCAVQGFGHAQVCRTLVSVQTEFCLTLNPWLVHIVLFCRFWRWIWPWRYTSSHLV